MSAALGPWEWTEPCAAPEREERLAQLQRDRDIMFQVPHEGFDGLPHILKARSRWVDSGYGAVIVAVVRDVTREVNATRALEHSVRHDDLTGLGNRRLLAERLESAVTGVARHGDRSGVLCMDLDDFKAVNDAMGHAVGDEVLAAVAARLKKAFRTGDTVARLGGDEFIAVLPRLDTEESLTVIAEEVAELISGPMDLDGCSVRVNTSIGGILLDPADDVAAVMRRVDLVMYRAKRSTHDRALIDAS